jgi:hypothetical protein
MGIVQIEAHATNDEELKHRKSIGDFVVYQNGRRKLFRGSWS